MKCLYQLEDEELAQELQKANDRNYGAYPLAKY
jgi:hypothetical protein